MFGMSFAEERSKMMARKPYYITTVRDTQSREIIMVGTFTNFSIVGKVMNYFKLKKLCKSKNKQFISEHVL